MSITWKSPNISRTANVQYVGVANYKSGRGRKSFCIKLSAKFLDDMRWRIGDRVAVGADNSWLYLKRDDAGYVISADTITVERRHGPPRIFARDETHAFREPEAGRSGTVSLTEDEDVRGIKPESYVKDDVRVDGGVVSFAIKRVPF